MLKVRLGLDLPCCLQFRTVVLNFIFQETSMLSFAQIAARMLRITQTAWSLRPRQANNTAPKRLLTGPESVQNHV